MTTGQGSVGTRLRASIPAAWQARLGPIVAAWLAALGAVASQTGVPRYRTIWAEDGEVLPQCAYTARSALDCVLTAYDGWLHLVPRVLAEVATLLPPVALSVALNGLSAIVAAGCAYLTARAVRDVTGSGVAGCVAGASLLLIAPATREVGGNVTNLHWIMFVAAVSVIVAAWLDHPFDVADGILVVLVTLSSPFGLVLLTFGAVGVALGRRSLRMATVVTALCVAVQLAMALTTPRNGVRDVPVSFLSPIEWYVRYVVGAGAYGNRGLIPDELLAVGVVVCLVGLVGRLVVDHRAGPRTVDGAADRRRAWLEVGAVVALLAVGAAIFAASTYLNRHVTPRYQYVPVALGMVALFVSAGVLARRVTGRPGGWRPGWPGPSSIALVVLAVVVGIGFATTFRTRNLASAGPNVPVEIATRRGECEGGVTELLFKISPLPTNGTPYDWQVVIPCDRLAP
jgi:hypothetical protein